MKWTERLVLDEAKRLTTLFGRALLLVTPFCRTTPYAGFIRALLRLHQKTSATFREISQKGLPYHQSKLSRGHFSWIPWSRVTLKHIFLNMNQISKWPVNKPPGTAFLTNRNTYCPNNHLEGHHGPAIHDMIHPELQDSDINAQLDIEGSTLSRILKILHRGVTRSTAVGQA